MVSRLSAKQLAWIFLKKENYFKLREIKETGQLNAIPDRILDLKKAINIYYWGNLVNLNILDNDILSILNFPSVIIVLCLCRRMPFFSGNVC